MCLYELQSFSEMRNLNLSCYLKLENYSSGFCPLFEIPSTVEHNFSETGERERERLSLLGPLERANLITGQPTKSSPL
jgi:hypothetical protein